MAETELRIGINPRDAVAGAKRVQDALNRVSGSARGATGAVGGTETGFGQLRTSSRLLSGALAAIGLGSITLAFKGAASVAIDFERAMTGVAKTVDASAETIAKMGEELKGLSERIPVTVTELAGIAEAAGQLGIKTENILEFTEVMAALGVSTNLAADEAATALARLANVMGSSQGDFDRMGSTIVDLGNNLATTEAEIVSFATRMAGAGRIAGLTEANVLAIGGAMSSVGVEAEAGGTAVQQVLIEMNTAVAQGNEKLAGFASAAGMSAGEFAAVWKSDAGSAFASFVEGIGRAGDDAVTILDGLGLSNQRLLRAFLSLGNAGDLLRDSLDRANTAWDENTALTTEASKFYDILGSDLVELGNLARNVAGEFGAMFTDEIRSGAELLSTTLGAIRTHMSQMADLAASLAIAVGVTGLSFAFYALATSATVALIPSVTSLAAAIALLQISIGPLGWFTLGVTAIAGVVYAWRRAHDGQADELRAVATAADAAASSIKALSGEQLMSTERTLRSSISLERGKISKWQDQIASGKFSDATVGDLETAIGRARGRGIALGQQLTDVQDQMRKLQTLPEIVLTVTADTSQAIEALTDAQRKFLSAGAGVSGPGGLIAGGLDPEVVAQFNARKAHAASLNLTLPTAQAAAGTPGFTGAEGAQGKMSGALSSAMDALGQGMSQLWAKFGPAGLAIAALFDIVSAALKPLRPVIDALREPLRIIGTLIGQTLAPVLELLVPIVNALAKAFTFGQQAVGYLVQALGWLIDHLVPDFISKVGQGMEQWGKDMVANSKAARAAIGATNDFTDAINAATVNIPKALPLAFLRQQAGMSNPPGSTGGTGGTGGSGRGRGREGDDVLMSAGNETWNIVVNGAVSAQETAQAVMDEIRRAKGRGQSIELDRHYQLRPV